jgi:hypothetical protein
MALAFVLGIQANAATWTGSTTIQPGEVSLWSFVDADGTGTADSASFRVRAPSALICFDPDTGGTAGTGVVTPRHCTNNTKPATNPENECISLGTLDGTEGAAATQNACVRIPNGTYFIDVTTPCNTDACRVTINGEY